MSSYKKYLQAKGLTRNTQECYHRHTLEFISWLDQEGIEAEEVTPRDVMAYMDKLQKTGLKPITMRLRLGVLNHYYNWQIKTEKRTTNPTKHIKLKGVDRQQLYQILSIAEMNQLHEKYQVPQPDDPRSNRNWFDNYRLSRARNKVILSLLIHQGLTTAEVVKLTVKDLALREGTIYIAPTRRSNERTLELKSHQVMDLMEYQLKTRAELLAYHEDKSTDQLFLAGLNAGSKTAKTGMTMGIWKRFVEDLRKLNPKLQNLNHLRASVITGWLDQYNLREVQYMAGHKNVMTTERYKINQLEDLQKDIDQYHLLT